MGTVELTTNTNSPALAYVGRAFADSEPSLVFLYEDEWQVRRGSWLRRTYVSAPTLDWRVITIQGEYNATGHLSAFTVESLLATRRCHVGYFELSVEDILNEEARTEALRMFVDDNDLVRYQLVPELSTFLALIPPERLQGPHSFWNTEAW